MKYLQNIEKSAFHRGQYVGYGGGTVWHITRTTSSDGNWAAHDHFDYNRRITTFGLQKLSDALAALAV